MTMTATPPDVLLLPEAPPRLGPVSRRLLMRVVVGLAVLEAIGAWLVLGVGGDGARAAGLSLALPGAGFLSGGPVLLFPVTLALLVVALVLWWGASAHLAIPLVWAASVAGSAALASGARSWAIPATYVLVGAALGAALWRFESTYRSKRAKVPELNEHLRTFAVPDPAPRNREPDAMDAELLRWAYDLAHQPDDGLKGLDWGEQLHGGTQLRYQLNTFCWALSVFAANVVPNAPDQVERALAKLIEKHTDLRVWRYWRTLNLLGNFDPNPDPIVRDNIMFSAFLGDVLNMYEAATGSDRFDRPGSLTFVWKDGRTFAYDHHSIAAAVKANYDKSTLGFFPCEPGWSFTVCNIMGAQSLLGHDTLHGSALWDEVRPRWQRTLDEEYLTPDGTYAHIRSTHLGLSWDTGEVPGGHYYANGSNRFRDILPDHARRASALELRGAAEKIGGLAMLVADGRLELEVPEEPERHRTRSSALPPWNKIIAAAGVLGSTELHDAALDASARQCGTGARWPERPLRAGASALAQHMLIRWSAPLGTAALNVRGYRPPTGPVLRGSGEDVLVTKARSSDGRRLELALEAWHGDAVGPVLLELEQLAPGTSYAVRSDTATIGRLVARPDGTGSVEVAVGPEPLRLEIGPEDLR